MPPKQAAIAPEPGGANVTDWAPLDKFPHDMARAIVVPDRLTGSNSVIVVHGDDGVPTVGTLPTLMAKPHVAPVVVPVTLIELAELLNALFSIPDKVATSGMPENSTTLNPSRNALAVRLTEIRVSPAAASPCLALGHTQIAQR
jgi:hypothetical protein